MSRILILFFLIVTTICQAQIQEDFPVLDNTNLPDAKFQPARHFTGKSLYGYMNGGAELYREYGIENAMITEFDMNDGHYKCEIFKMTGPEEAYGIYSVSKFKCLSTPGFSQYACLNRYQIQICKGPYYINIINRSGTTADSLTALKTAMILADRISDSSFDLNSFIPDADPEIIKGNAILAKGKLGLANGSPEWEDYFSEIIGYSALIFTSGEFTILSVIINNPEDFNHFISSHGWGLCDLSVSDVKKPGGVTLRVLGDNHLLIKIEN